MGGSAPHRAPLPVPLEGQAARLDDLIGSFRAGWFPHALLIHGARGAGKRTLAAYLARMALCGGETRPCGQCPACARFLSGNHPDALTVRREKASIGVGEARALLHTLAEAPYEGRMRTVTIEEADKLTPQAQNALLKTLEEPPADTLFMLLAEKPGDLLMTVRSRLSPVRLAPLEQAAIVSILTVRGVEPGRARAAAALSDGYVGRALDICASDEALDMHALAVELLLDTSAPVDVIGAFKRIKNLKDDAAALLGALEGVLSMLLKARCGLDAVPQDDARLNKLLSRFTLGKINVMMEACVQARMRLSANVAYQSVMEALLRAMT